MEVLKDVCEVISGFAAVIAIIISIVFYRYGVNKERKVNTIKDLSEIRRKFFNTKDLDKKEKLKYLNELEFFATGINNKIYDIRTVEKMSGSRLIKQYDGWAASFIAARKEHYRNDNAYSEYEKMIKQLKRIRQTKKGRRR